MELPIGTYTVFDIDEKTGLWTRRFSKKNQIQWDWGAIACQLLGLGESAYKINAVYIEYENVASSSDPASIPSFGRDEGVEYYSTLAAGRDYLRVPVLSTPSLSVEDDYDSYFTGDGVSNNRLTWLAQSSGTSGSNGEPFASASNSKVCGIALVAAPDWSDRSQDLIFARGYYDVDDQVLKQASKQIGVSWGQTFG